LKESIALNSIVRLRGAAIAIAGLFVMAGCGPQEKIVAEVNDDTIKEDEYNSRVQMVTAIPETIATDAGGMTVINMVRDKLTEQLAKNYHAVPLDETVTAAADYQARMDPMTSAGLAAGKLTREDLKRQKKFELEAFGIGTNGDKPNEQDVDKAFEDLRNKPDIRIKPSYLIKILRVPDAGIGSRAITELKQSGDFKSVAQKVLGLSALDALGAGKEQTLSAEQCPPELRQALDALKPNEITPTTVEMKISNPQQPASSQTMYAVAQLKSKEPERILSKAEVRFLLVPVVLQKTHPDWKDHYRMELGNYTRKSKIRIAIPRYEGLADTFIRAQANANSMPRSQTAPGSPQPGIPQ
jgi:hypothetical protein